MRGSAALAVVVFHAGQVAGIGTRDVGRPFVHLGIGVSVFFVLTGFLLYRPFAAASIGNRPAVWLGSYAWSRIGRIVPAYWVALLVLVPLLGFAAPMGIPNALFVQIYRPSAWGRTGIFPAWSLDVEVSFYALLPLYAGAARRRWSGLTRADRCRRELAVLLLLALGAVGVGMAYHRWSVHSAVVYLPPAPFAWFVGGMGLAVFDVCIGARRLAARRPRIVCWGAAAGLYACMLGTPYGGTQGGSVLFLVYALIATLIVAPVVGDRAAPKLHAGAALRWLGASSYGLYLYHYPLMHAVGDGGAPGSIGAFVRLLLLGGGAAVVCGGVSRHLIERPIMRQIAARRRAGESRRHQALAV